jgi:type II secretory pathway pseudopilin PulG
MSNLFLSSNSLEKGSIYIWMLFTVTIAGILLAATGQVWQVKAQREKEKELLLVGEQFRQAVMSYYNSVSGGDKKYPQSLEDLLLDKRGPNPERHLRKIFLDPMTKTTEWGLVEEPVPEQSSGSSASVSRSDLGIIGVYSLSRQGPIKSENFPEHYKTFAEASTYQDWQFVYSQESAEGGSKDGKEKENEQPASSQPDANSPFSSQGQGASNNSGSGGLPLGGGQGQTGQDPSGSSLFQ